ncbi:MAG TPA: MYXO-CTERM sorting domain-containing protein [Polyangia bacterium]|nr:MYXO-CTERM sorting domain-containing protein [Polyangia bacterium]
MGRPPRVRIALAFVCSGFAACAPGATDVGNVGEQQAPILGGAADTTDTAVMALIHQMGTSSSAACTGTVIAKQGSSGILMTAGHCVVATANGMVSQPVKVASPADLFVIPGNDWQTAIASNQYFDVSAVQVHPSYDGTVNSFYDMALVRFVGATNAMPTIPAMAPAEDKLTTGSAFTLVGYGETETNKDNSQRREVARTIETISDHQFEYNQTDIKGACSGDSGGPALVMTANGLRVGGVTSYGDQSCMQIGVSVRVSPLNSFITSFINGTPLVLNCDECTSAAVSPGNTCTTQADACGTAQTACGQFLTCADACTTSACVQSCTSKNPSGAAAYDALAKCQCTSCASPCSTDSACSSYLAGTTTPPVSTKCGGVTNAVAACNSCITGTCCSQASTCANDPICSSCLTQSSISCRVDSAYAALITCEAGCQGAPCSGGGTTTGGTTGATGGSTGAATGGTTGATGGAGGDATTGAGGDTTAGGGGSKGGCSCDVGGGPMSPLASALSLLALAFVRRRR